MSKLYPTLAVMCLAVSACTTSLQPGVTPTAYDGTYRGMTSPAHYSANTCGSMNPKQVNFVVQNGRVVWTPVPGRTVYAPIMQGGAFAAAYGSTMMLSGKVTDTTILAHSDDGSCHVTYSLQRQTT